MSEGRPLSLAVIGAGPAGLAAALYGRERGWTVRVFEQDERPGGKVRTSCEEGFVIEHGPNGWLDREPHIADTCRRLQLEALAADPRSKTRYVLRDGRLHPVPMSPPALLRTSLLSWRARLRLLSEAWRAPRGQQGEETIHDFMTRRLGREATEILVDAGISGILAGDIHELSLDACFPRLLQGEREHGSLIRMMMAARRQKARNPSSAGSGQLLSFPSGMQSLIEGCAAALGDELQCAAGIETVRPEGGSWSLLDTAGNRFEAERLIVTTPAAVTGRLLQAFAPSAEAFVRAVPTIDIATVFLAFPRERVRRAAAGFGFLAPRSEGFRPLGTLFVHDIFTGQCPPGLCGFRVMLGGAHDPEILSSTDEELRAIALESLAPLLGLEGEPERAWIGRAPGAIPQYLLGHRERLDRLEQELHPIGKIRLAGDAFRGVGLNSAFVQAHDAVQDLE